MTVDTAQRRSIRLQGYDYSGDGGYFLTICAHRRASLFGEIVDGQMQLSEWGEIVQQEWLQTAVVRPYVVLDDFVVMPNHFHAIVFIMKPDDQPRDVGTPRPDGDTVGARRAVPLQPQHAFGKPVAGSLPTIVGAFKSAVTKRINEQRGTPGTPVWQRNYYEHVIRNELSLNDIRSYVQTNPARWAEDDENPANAAGVDRSNA